MTKPNYWWQDLSYDEKITVMQNSRLKTDTVEKIKRNDIMTPKQKAEELAEKYYQLAPKQYGSGQAIQFGIDMALVFTRELLDMNILLDEDVYVETVHYQWFWKDVEKELETI